MHNLGRSYGALVLALVACSLRGYGVQALRRSFLIACREGIACCHWRLDRSHFGLFKKKSLPSMAHKLPEGWNAIRSGFLTRTQKIKTTPRGCRE